MSIGVIIFIFGILFFIYKTILKDAENHKPNPQFKGVLSGNYQLNNFDLLVKNLKTNQETNTNQDNFSDYLEEIKHEGQPCSEEIVKTDKKEIQDSEEFDLKSAIIYSSIMDRKKF